jgi:hypothetical protein
VLGNYLAFLCSLQTIAAALATFHIISLQTLYHFFRVELCNKFFSLQVKETSRQWQRIKITSWVAVYFQATTVAPKQQQESGEIQAHSKIAIIMWQIYIVQEISRCGAFYKSFISNYVED